MEPTQLNWITNFIWGIADDVLRDLYVRGKYRDVILPMTVLRRLDAVLEPTKPAVLEMKAALDRRGIVNQDAALRSVAGRPFYNASKFRLLKGEKDVGEHIVGGPEYSTLSRDAFPSMKFDFMLSNPPYGKSWKSDQERMGGRGDIRDRRFVIQHAGDPEYSLITPPRRAEVVPGEHGQQDEAEHAVGQPHRGGAQRLVAVHRRRRAGGIQHPPLDH